MEGMVTRKVELRGIGFFSTFKIYFGITVVFSLVFFILFNLFGMQIVSSLMNIIMHIRNLITELQTRFPMIFENQIISFLMLSILYGTLVGLFTAISAGIFSLFALLLGGIQIKIREKTAEKKSAYI